MPATRAGLGGRSAWCGWPGTAATIARFGGDEFLALFVSPARCGHADGLGVHRAGPECAERAVRGRQGPRSSSTLSVGVALNTFGVDDGTELLANAEAAMYQAKRRGGSSVETFGESMRIEVLDRMTTEHSLHRALERRELMLHYQPVVEIDGVTTVGVEALIRWQHPDQGLVSPYRFIPVAEESGLIIPIGAWVLEQACHQLRDWHHRGRTGPQGSVEVNLSARQIDDARIVETVEEILTRTGLPAEHLTLEITESALMQDAAAALDVLRALKELGVLLAIDDFGTGYSSLSYLQRFPLDILKIDRSFVEDARGRAPKARRSWPRSSDLAHALGLKVVAEGVETTGQLEILRSLECDLAQGFLFSRPLPAAEIIGVVRAAGQRMTTTGPRASSGTGTRPGCRSGRRDLNPRPPAPKAGALPSCATSRRFHCRPPGSLRRGPAREARRRDGRSGVAPVGDSVTPVPTVRVAVFDLGSSSFHLMVVDASRDGVLTPVLRRRSFLHLGTEVARTGGVPADRAASAVRTVRRLPSGLPTTPASTWWWPWPPPPSVTPTTGRG